MLLSFLNITTWLENHQLPCIIKKTLNIDCPGCGIQRSFIALLKGEIVKSLQLYPALIPIIVFLSIIILNHKLNFLKSGKMVQIGVPFIFIIILVSYFIKLSI
jgi:Protein of unknown function (DUF2752)